MSYDHDLFVWRNLQITPDQVLTALEASYWLCDDPAHPLTHIEIRVHPHWLKALSPLLAGGMINEIPYSFLEAPADDGSAVSINPVLSPLSRY